MTDQGARPAGQVTVRPFRVTVRRCAITLGLIEAVSVAWLISMLLGGPGIFHATTSVAYTAGIAFLTVEPGFLAIVVLLHLALLARDGERYAQGVTWMATRCAERLVVLPQELPTALRSTRSRGRKMLIHGLTSLAGRLAGQRHAHLRGAWAADLYGNPETGQLPPFSRCLRLAAGDVKAALRCRLDDTADLAWRPVDALISSWHGSNLAMTMPVTVALGLVLTREGFYGLIANAENLGVIAAAPYPAIKGLRKYRQIDTPKRPERRAESARGAKR